MKKSLRSYGAALCNDIPEFQKGETVIVTKRRSLNEDGYWNGKYEYHYMDLAKSKLVRTSYWLLEQEKEKHVI